MLMLLLSKAVGNAHEQIKFPMLQWNKFSDEMGSIQFLRQIYYESDTPNLIRIDQVCRRYDTKHSGVFSFTAYIGMK
jgi:hypothetical protein